MQDRLNWRFLAALALAPLCLAQEASADSRFELGEAEPVTARSRIDITIVVPAFLRLQSARSTGPALPPPTLPSPVRVVGNAQIVAPTVMASSTKLPYPQFDDMDVTNVINFGLGIAVP